MLDLKLTKASYLRELTLAHPVSNHAFLNDLQIDQKQAMHLLTNYDAHATLLRRLLLLAATRMPEPAVGFILENVRNEYGNGQYSDCHQGQLRDLIHLLSRQTQGVVTGKISPGVRLYMKNILKYYLPKKNSGYYRPAVIAGAISATEIMAMEEFKSLHKIFIRFNLENHRWFDHLIVEQEHSDEALYLAEYFLGKGGTEIKAAVERGFSGVLDANLHLYDGLLESTHF